MLRSRNTIVAVQIDSSSASACSGRFIAYYILSLYPAVEIIYTYFYFTSSFVETKMNELVQ